MAMRSAYSSGSAATLSLALAMRRLLSPFPLRGDLLRYAHPPRVHDQLPHLGLVDLRQPNAYPLIPHVGRSRQEELVRFGGDQRGAFLLGEAEPHRLLVGRNRCVDDLADPELHMVANEMLTGPRQRHRDAANPID